ncbi:MAG: hypothetical protein R3B70_28150 [Polyangiaceae bacterium]
MAGPPSIGEVTVAGTGNIGEVTVAGGTAAAGTMAGGIAGGAPLSGSARGGGSATRPVGVTSSSIGTSTADGRCGLTGGIRGVGTGGISTVERAPPGASGTPLLRPSAPPGGSLLRASNPRPIPGGSLLRASNPRPIPGGAAGAGDTRDDAGAGDSRGG